jgi:hypothetical protein
MQAVNEDINRKDEAMAEGQEELENWWEDVTWRAQEVSLPANMATYAPPADNECW